MSTIPLAPHLPLVHAHGDGRATLTRAACSCGSHHPLTMSEADTRLLAGALLAAADGLTVTKLLNPHGGEN